MTEKGPANSPKLFRLKDRSGYTGDTQQNETKKRRGNHAQIVARGRRRRHGSDRFVLAAAGRARRRRPAARHRSLQDLVQRGGAAPLRPRHALPALLLVPPRQGGVRGGAEGRPDLRHGAVGHRADAARQSAQRDPAAQPRARPRRHPEGQGDGRQDRARARLHRRADADVRRLRQAQPSSSASARSATRRRRSRRSIRTTTRRRSPTPSRSTPRPTSNDKTYAQQTKGAAILEPISQAAAAASGRHALPDPPLRLSGNRREGPRSGQPLRQGRAGRAARPAHAVAHLHPRRLLEGVDRFQHRLGEGREGGEVGRQLSARPGLHGLCPPPARPGQAGARRHGRDDEGDRFQGDRLGRPLCAGGLAGALCGRARRLERARRSCRSGRAPSTT